jgi:hypothetical protein
MKPCICALVGQGEAASVAQHMRMGKRGKGRELDRRAYSHGRNVLEQLRGCSMQDCIADRDASTPNVLCILVAVEKLLQPGREEGADF